MDLPFLNRDRERARLQVVLARRHDSLVCVYGRRRLGKSRLIREILSGRSAAYYVGDERDGALQREALAREIAALVPGFADVVYPGWEALLARWWETAPAGAVLALDEFPLVVAASPELPSLLQKLVDRRSGKSRKTIVCGSSQEMMHGLVLDGSAPLYGRCEEILRIEPLGPGCLKQGFGLKDATATVDTYALWGGVPRYWELALGCAGRNDALARLVLDPLAVLHREPERLLRDDIRDSSRAASILALIAQGSHRLSEIGGRLGQPATSLARPLARLVDLGFVTRETPWGASPRDSKRSFYRLADPFLRFWYRFVEPNRSRLGAGRIDAVVADMVTAWPAHVAGVWEDLVRAAIPRRRLVGTSWSVASRWWGKGLDGQPIEIDALAASSGDPDRVLVVEVKLSVRAGEVAGLLAELERKAARCPVLVGKRVVATLWVLRPPRGGPRPRVFSGDDVVAAL